MAEGLDLSTLVAALAGGVNATQQNAPQEEGGIFGNVNPDQLSIMAGQLAEAIAPGTIGAALGQIGAGQAQSSIAAGAEQDQQMQLLNLLQGLTGEGVNTTGVTIGEDGKIKVSGTAAPRTNAVQTGGETPQASMESAPFLKPLLDR